MQSSFWLGMNLQHTNSFINFIVNPIINLRIVKLMVLPDQLTYDLLKHCAEEMNHLAKFLPQLYNDV